jgi:hypothetical protein
MNVIEAVSVIYYAMHRISDTTSITLILFQEKAPKADPDRLTNTNQKKHLLKATFCLTHQIASGKGKRILKGLQKENLLHAASTHVAISYAAHSFSLVLQGSPPRPSACT